jgi:putative FmdB family regulatory protein
MPIYEYVCRHCGHQFEKIVHPSAPAPACPACHSHSLQQQFSVFAVRGKNAPAAKPTLGPCGSCGHPRGPGSCSFK